MNYLSVEFAGHRCFSGWAGFSTTPTATVIIGRNNTGKSQLLELVRLCCDTTASAQVSYRFTGILEEQDLRPWFPENHSGGQLHGNHWRDHGATLVGKQCTWEIVRGGAPDAISLGEFGAAPPRYVDPLRSALHRARLPFAGSTFRHLLADRDIRTEVASTMLSLGADGAGATNIIRRFIVSSSKELPRDLIQVQLLTALNEIFASDGQFTEIQVQQHDDERSDGNQEHWEVFLGERSKGLIALSRSGSGLKTTLLVLLNLLVLPRIEGRDASNYVYAFEELENNLHPALLRRLIRFVERHTMTHGCRVYLTTHSGVMLDYFGASEKAQIVHVQHDGERAAASVVGAHLDRLGVIAELGAKPSELLQANGIVWVEGPSDCVYLNAWIAEISGNTLKEGRDYLCAFYGGALLARTQFSSEEAADDELVNLLHVNPRVMVVCDSDRTAHGRHLKPRVRRIRAEIERIPGAGIWITECKEIENYLPGSVIGKALDLARAPRDPEQFEAFFPSKKPNGSSYLEKACGSAAYDKMDLAVAARRSMTLDAMTPRFDWKVRMEQLVATIRKWND